MPILTATMERKASRLLVRPSTLREANHYVRLWHSHNEPVRGCMFTVACETRTGDVVGVAIVGRPIAPALQDGRTIEVTRVATPGLRADRRCWGAMSMMIRSVWAAAWAIGVRRGVSYTRADESGRGYEVAGWLPVATCKTAAWTSGNKSLRWLPGLYVPTTEPVDRIRWEAPALDPDERSAL
jgi:hypothetical protein